MLNFGAFRDPTIWKGKMKGHCLLTSQIDSMLTWTTTSQTFGALLQVFSLKGLIIDFQPAVCCCHCLGHKKLLKGAGDQTTQNDRGLKSGLHSGIETLVVFKNPGPLVCGACRSRRRSILTSGGISSNIMHVGYRVDGNHALPLQERQRGEPAHGRGRGKL